MEHWECRFCKSLTAKELPTCWNCGRRFDDPTPISEVVAELRKRGWTKEKSSATNDDWATTLVGIVAAVVGALMFLFGLVRYNSMASQLVRAAGGNDSLGLFLLIAGGILAVGGIGAYFLYSDSSPASPAPSVVPAQSAAPVSGAEVAGEQRVQQLERLAALKERGLLTNTEFEEQKRKLLV